MNKKLQLEKQYWEKIESLRNEMVKKAMEKNLDFLDPEILSLSQELNSLLVEYEKLLHQEIDQKHME